MDWQESKNSPFGEIMNKDKLIEKLQEQIRKLKEEKEQIEEKLKKTEKEKSHVEEEKKKVEEEFEAFKLKHAGTVDELKQAMHIKPDVIKSSLKRGAQQGHKGYTRKVPERVDHIIALNPKQCSECRKPLPEETQEVRQRYITDITLAINVINTRYDIHRKYCRTCKKLVEPQVPKALPHARFGLNLMLFVMYLRFGLRLPVNKAREFLSTLCRLTISEGEIIHMSNQLAKAFGKYYASLELLLKFCKVKHSDTTSWRMNGKNYTAWVFITLGVVLYKITRKGTADTPLKLFGKEQQGNVLVVDRHSLFRGLAKKAGFILQLCWSHILDDTRSLARDFGREGKYVQRKLKLIFADAVSLHHQGTEGQVQKLKERVENLLARHYQHKTVWKFVKNLVKRDLEHLFIFVTRPDVDPTNNISERELRSIVLIRKISNGSRSEQGAATTATLLSIIQTLRLQKKNIFEGLQEILEVLQGTE